MRIRRRHKVITCFALAIIAGAMIGAGEHHVGRAQIHLHNYEVGIGSWGPIASIGCTMRDWTYYDVQAIYLASDEITNL